MNKIIKICTLLALLFSLSSCNLDKTPVDMIPTDEAMNNIDDAKQVIFGVYSAFKSGSLYSGSLTLAPDLQADYVYAVNGYSNGFGEEYRWEIKQTGNVQGAIYRDLYTVVGRANFFLNNSDKVEATLQTEADREMFRKCKGDAYFARALAYSELLKMYCGNYESDEKAKTALGIVLEDTFDPVQKPGMRSSLYDSYQAVLADLALAEVALDIRDGSDAPYFTVGTVQALTARMYLYMGHWEKADEYATKVIENDNYALAGLNVVGTPSGAMTEYENMWSNDTGSEIIWKVQLLQMILVAR